MDPSTFWLLHGPDNRWGDQTISHFYPLDIVNLTTLFSAGTFFARKMREAEYVTMIDPFTQKYAN